LGFDDGSLRERRKKIGRERESRQSRRLQHVRRLHRVPEEVHVFRVSFVNPPFAALSAPTFALTQLQELLRAKFDKEQVEVSVHYLNIDFAQYIGYELYNFIAGSIDALNSGIGEWMFRRVAFPDVADNTEQYARRYEHHLRRADGKSWLPQILEKREGLEELLDSLVARHQLERANIVGFTSMFAQNMASFAMARKVKARSADVLTIMGGANCESPMGEEIARRVDAVDYVFSGPALINFPQFIEHYINGEISKCDELDGVFPNVRRSVAPAVAAPAQSAISAAALRILSQDAPAVATVKRSAIGRDLDINYKIDLDYSQFLDTLTAAFPKQAFPFLFFETSRGCWWGAKAHCTFCGLNSQSMAYRAMNPELAIEQFRSLFKYADRVLELQCVDNIMPKEYVKDVLPFLDTPPSMHIFYEVKADLTEEEIKELARARVTNIQPGIEALATSTLKLMKKGTSAHQNIQFLKHCANYGLDPSWNLLIGFPGEREEVYRKYVADLPSLVHLPPPSGVFPVRFDRYSPYFMRADEYGLKLQPLEFYEMVYPFPPESIFQLAYFFSDENVFAEYAIDAGMWIGQLRERVNAWRERWPVTKTSEPPVLRFESADSTVIVDTRSKSMVRHDVGAAGRVVIESLSSKPRRTEDVARLLADQDIDVAKEIENLTERELLFEENGRRLSLVLQ
jgi:ribosomal peptide maturation radical SAM protein 1